MRTLIASLGHINEGVLGSDIAGAYITNVGLSMGAAIESEYKRFWGIDRPFTVDEYAHVIVDLKQKIHGNFSLLSSDQDKVVVTTTSCPFEDLVQQSPSLCFMTSSVFGGIAARNFGYAKVALEKRIALGDPGCHVVVHLRPTPDSAIALGREYFPDADLASPDIRQQLLLMDRVRELRERLDSTSQQWEELARAASDAVCVVDHRGRIVFANAAWRTLVGAEGGELFDESISTLGIPEDADRLAKVAAEATSGQRALGIEVRLRHRDGSARLASVSAGPLKDDRGQGVGALLVFHDMTARQELDRVKNEFLHATSHELRTPVTTIKGLAETMLRRLDRGVPMDDDRLRTHLEIIRHEADRLALVASDLSQSIDMQSGRPIRLRLVSVDIGELVRDCAEARIATSPRAADLTVKVSQSIEVTCDRVRIAQVLDNLLDNAFKYSEAGTPITVEVGASGDEAVIRVDDEGIGIPTDERDQVFEAFHRAFNVSSEYFEGMGLGLYLCATIVKAHGGTLTVAPKDVAGTTMEIRLPRLPVDA